MEIGIDLGGSHIGVGIVKDGQILYKFEKDLKQEGKGRKNIVELIKKVINEMLKSNDMTLNVVQKIGIACPGIVEDGKIKKAENLEITEIDFKKELENEYKNIEISIENDAKCAALAEKKYGALKNYDNAIMLTIGTGIGGAVFYNGEMLKARNSSAYELGHIIINKNGRECSCKSKGCFEAHCSIGNLRKIVKNELGMQTELSGPDLVEKLKSKDAVIEKILSEYIEDLAIGLSNLINIFEPEIIVLGGSIVYYKEIILERLENKLKQENYIFNKNNIPQIIMASLNNNAGMIGATIK